MKKTPLKCLGQHTKILKYNTTRCIDTYAPPKRASYSVRLRQREAVLNKNPLCVECQKQGRIKAAEEIDHIVPLWADGKDELSNLQGLCKPCHKAKTAEEAQFNKRKHT